ncbi:MAG: hypothetical protein ACXAAH_10350 [Promethearchaeota archaeon]|jgi:hypothetical protein
MVKLKHKIMRVGEGYQVQRMFKADGINPIWITKRVGYPDTPGAFVHYRFLNQAIKDIRAERRGIESFIILDKSVLKHLRAINFDDESIKLLVGNKENNDAPTTVS